MMIGRAVGAIARRSIARSIGLTAAAGTGGASPLPAILGAALPTALRRVSPAALLAVAAGGLVVRRLAARRHRQQSPQGQPQGQPTEQQATAPSAPAPGSL